MKTALKTLLVAVLAVVGTSSLFAIDPAEGDQAKGKLPPQAQQFTQAVTKIGLNEGQKEQYQQIFKQHAPQLQKLYSQQMEIYTPEQVKARQTAMKQGKEEGLQGQKLQQFVQSAVQFTPEQKKQFVQCQTETAKCEQKFESEVVQILTATQKEQLPELTGKGKKGGKGKVPNEPKQPKIQKQNDKQ
ncbi:MAG: hypothetical protein KDA41_01185 [Planctomycetales bacterium]|nr:hypothetical protein [Planctomycetales bacterium]